MHHRCWLVGGLLAAAILSQGCGEGQAPPPPLNTRLGGADHGTPFGAGPIDRGILQDQTTYTPAPMPNVGGGGAGGSSVAAGSGDVKNEVLALYDGLLKAGLDCDVETALGAYQPEHVAEVLKDTSALLDTCQKVTTLCGVIGAKIGRENYTLRSLIADVMPMLAMFGVPNVPLEAPALFEVSVVDSENATVQPKFGSGPPEIVRKGPDGWKIQRAAAITAEEVEELKTRLKPINAWLDKVTDLVEKSDAKTLPEIFAVVTPAFAELQAAVGMPGAEAPPAGETPPGEEPPGAAPPADEPGGIIGPDGRPVGNPRMGGGGNTNDNDGG